MNTATARGGFAFDIADCRLCPRQCGIDRTHGKRGFCGAGADTILYRYAPHHGEEPPLAGVHGSGTVFFSHCTLQCLYCQNYPWSQEHAGTPCSVTQLVGVLRALHAQGCHNWNLVSPTPWLPAIVEALARLRAEGIRLPVVYNTSGFERPETLEALADSVDIYLTDLRYADPANALAGSGRADYAAVAREALRVMWRQKGPLRLADDGTALAGVICRILVLPGMADDAAASLSWLADSIGPDIAVSLMAQYTPAHRAIDLPPWNRRVTPAEYGRVTDRLEALGLANGWVQDLDGETDRDLLGFAMLSEQPEA